MTSRIISAGTAPGATRSHVEARVTSGKRSGDRRSKPEVGVGEPRCVGFSRKCIRPGTASTWPAVSSDARGVSLQIGVNFLSVAMSLAPEVAPPSAQPFAPDAAALELLLPSPPSEAPASFGEVQPSAAPVLTQSAPATPAPA